MNKFEYRKIELRSEEVQEVMGKIPPWGLRWGITTLFFAVVVIISGSCFFKYPDVIATEMTLTGRYPAAQIIARASGKISRLYVFDGQPVHAGTPLAAIENPASANDVAQLKTWLKTLSNQHDTLSIQQMDSKEWSLGEIQSAYTNFLTALNESRNYYEVNYYKKKIEAVKMQIDKYKSNYQNQQRQLQVMEAQHILASKQYKRDSLLFARGVLSPAEHETALAVYLQSRYAMENGYIAMTDMQIRVGELETNLLDLNLQQAERESVLQQNYQSESEQLMNAIRSWELTYIPTSPIYGNVTFTKYWSENQFVQIGETVCTIVPDENETVIGKALLPIQRSGKVREGQRVIIRFANFPDQEFGIVYGEIKSISLVPAENNYQVEISFTNGLITNYNKTLPAIYEMKATAEIVTDDLRLIERFFMPFKRVFEEGF